MSGVNCCIVGCTNNGRKKGAASVRYFRIPAVITREGKGTEEMTTTRRLAWLQAINRKELTMEEADKKPWLRVCSEHFHEGKPSYKELCNHPDWIPSLNLGYKEENLHYARLKNRKRKKLENFTCNVSCKGSANRIMADQKASDITDAESPKVGNKSRDSEETGSLDMSCEDDAVSTTSKHVSATNITPRDSTAAHSALTGKETEPMRSSGQSVSWKGSGFFPGSPQEASNVGQCTLTDVGTDPSWSQISGAAPPTSRSTEVPPVSLPAVASLTALPTVVPVALKPEASVPPSIMRKGKYILRKLRQNCNTHFPMPVPSNLNEKPGQGPQTQGYTYYLCGEPLYSTTGLIADDVEIPQEFYSFQCKVCAKGFFDHAHVKVQGDDVLDYPPPHSLTEEQNSGRCGEETSRVVAWGYKPLNICTCCRGCFFSEIEFTMHRKKAKEYFTCPFCEQNFNTVSEMAGHWEIMHSTYRRGDRRSNEKKYCCGLCNYTCVIWKSYSLHVRRHSDERPCLCDRCGWRCKVENSLREHMKTHTGEKPYECRECGKQFAGRSQCQAHMRVHTGEKPYQCPHCSRCFSQKQSMNAHIRTHTGESPYCCSFCDARFKTCGSKQAHEYSHTGRYPYSCLECGQRFHRKKELRRHDLETHMNKDKKG